MNKENFKDLGEFEIVRPAEELFHAIKNQTEVLKNKPVDDRRLKEFKIAIGAMNSFINAFKTKTRYFQLTEVPAKIAAVKGLFKRGLR